MPGSSGLSFAGPDTAPAPAPQIRTVSTIARGAGGNVRDNSSNHRNDQLST